MTRRHRALLHCLVPLLIGACRSADAAAASLRIPHPDDPAKSVEYFMQRPDGTGPWPTVVLLHGHQDGAKPGGRDFVDWGVLTKLAARGYLAVAISQPGYGASDGPADFSGVFTQHAVTGVIAELRSHGLGLPDRLLLQGISRGALTAGLVAAQDTSVSGVVLISGVYDLPTYAADASMSLTKRAIVASMRSETVGSPEALVERSLLHRAGALRASALILNGADDDRTDPAQAQALADSITRRGGKARAIIYPKVGHQIPVALRNREIDPFIDEVLGAQGRGTDGGDPTTPG